jgi:hypothetical protein
VLTVKIIEAIAMWGKMYVNNRFMYVRVIECAGFGYRRGIKILTLLNSYGLFILPG